MKRRFVMAACAAVWLAALPAAAQDARLNATGFGVGAHLIGGGIRPYDADDENDEGGGLGLRLSYGFTRAVAVYLQADGLRVESDAEDEYDLGFVDLGVRLSLNGGGRWAPYFDGALTAAGTRLDQDVTEPDGGGDVGDLEYAGGGLTLGGGTQLFVSRTLAVDAALRFTFGAFGEGAQGDDEIEPFDDIDFAGSRLNLGVSWYP